MAESEEATSSTVELEDKIRELEEENRELRAENKQLGATVLEYQYRTREKPMPPKDTTLKKYIDDLKRNKAKGNFVLTDVTLDSLRIKYDKQLIIATSALGIFIPILSWPLIPTLAKYCKNAGINLSDNKGNSLEFTYFYHLNQQP